MPKQDESFFVGDAVTVTGTPYKGTITGICEDMPHAPFIVGLVHSKDETRKKVWRFSLDGKYCPQNHRAKIKKIKKEIGAS